MFKFHQISLKIPEKIQKLKQISAKIPKIPRKNKNLEENTKMTEKNPDPWTRQKGESGAVYALFNEYLKLGPLRTIVKLSKKLQDDPKWKDVPSPDALNKKSTTWKWKDRAEDYDTHRIEEERKELEEYSLNRRKERLNQSHVQSKIIHRKFVEHLGTDEEKEELGIPKKIFISGEGQQPPSALSEAKIASELMKGKRIVEESERLDTGDVTERTEQKGKIKLESENDEIVSEVDDLFEEAEKANDEPEEGDGD